ELRERGFALDALGVVAGDDEDLRGSVDTDAELVQQMRRPPENELLDLLFELGDLLIERDPAFRDRPERVTVRVLRRFAPTGPERGAATGDHLLRLPRRLASEILGSVDAHRFEGDHRSGQNLYRG